MDFKKIFERLLQRPAATRQRARRAAQAGFSLIELMIAMVVSAIVLVGVFAFSGVTSATSDQFTRGIKIQQGLESAMATMGNDIRLAGLGFAPMCNELRIQGVSPGESINPSRTPISQFPPTRDGDTDEVYWVLRDGIQAYWRSSEPNQGAPSDQQIVFPSPSPTSAKPQNMADALDVALGEPGFVQSVGAFRLTSPIGGAGDPLMISGPASGPNVLDSGEPMDANAVRHLFPPGSFMMLMSSDWSPNANSDTGYNDCMLVQVTGEADPAGGPEFAIPADPWSHFNQSLVALANGTTLTSPGTIVVPLGRFRWSRYEIDYTVEEQPFLVRTELISWVEGDPVFNPQNQYPSCGVDGGGGGIQCKVPQLHLPQGTQSWNGTDTPARRVPIAPMIEDMQVAVGCDPIDYGASELPGPTPLIPEKGAREGLPTDNQPNMRIDEYVLTNERNIDEWVGNAIAELETPDCVHWGSGETNPDGWTATGNPTDRFLDGGWHISPQVVRVTLLGKSEFRASGSIASDTSPLNHYNRLMSIEDRPATNPMVRGREYRTLTEVYRPKNLTYRHPHIP